MYGLIKDKVDISLLESLVLGTVPFSPPSLPGGLSVDYGVGTAWARMTSGLGVG